MEKKKLLIVDDALTNRELMKLIFEQDYETLEARNGIEALAVLNEKYEEISAVILDIVMPEMNGHELLEAIRKTPNISDIPVIVVTVVNEPENEVKALDLGATDFVSKPFNATVVLQRVKNAIPNREANQIKEQNNILSERARVNESLAYIAYHDALTGIYNRMAFYELTDKLIKENPDVRYSIVCMNIERFKIVNDAYGKSVGDSILVQIADALMKKMQDCGTYCRLENDRFAFCIPSEQLNTEELKDYFDAAFQVNDSLIDISICFGIYEIVDNAVSIDKMCDRADLAMQKIKGNYIQKFAYYDSTMLENLIMEQEIISEMQQALDDKQFDIFLQAQINHATKEIIGAEALVRWIHPTKGMISPGIFIPIFEHNGFITSLDEFVWERACQVISSRILRGLPTIPISVNISRIDIYNPRLVDVFTGLIEKYNLSPDLLRLEITESAYMNNAQQLIHTVKELQNHGFFIEMDDFGSGYSSLNTLKDVPIDMLKLDLMFLRGEENVGRGGNILSSVVRMAKWLSLPVIAEGVETQWQADYLRSIGCTYVQGYLYSKPLSVSAFEEWSEKMECDEVVTSDPIEGDVDLNSFWNPDALTTLVFNNYIDAACVLELYEGKFELIRANEKLYKVLRIEPQHLTETYYDLSQLIVKSDYKELMNKIETAIDTHSKIEFEARFKPAKEIIWIRIRLRLLAHSELRYVLFAEIEDVTEKKLLEESLKDKSAQLSSILNNTPCGMVQLTYDYEKLNVEFVNELFCTKSGYSRETIMAPGFDILTIAYPEDRAAFLEDINISLEQNKSSHTEFRMERDDGEIRWFKAIVSRLNDDSCNFVSLLAIFTDITELKLIEKRLMSTENTLVTKIREQEIIMNNMQESVALFEIGENIRLLYANDRYFTNNGYTKDEVGLTGNELLKVHPEDISRLTECIQKGIESYGDIECEYRARRKDGVYRDMFVHATRIEYETIENPVYLAVLNDITELKKAERDANRVAFSKALFSIYNEVFKYDYRLDEFTLMYSRYVDSDKYGTTFELNQKTTSAWINEHIQKSDRDDFVRFLSKSNFDKIKKTDSESLRKLSYYKEDGCYSSIIVPIDSDSFFLCTKEIEKNSRVSVSGQASVKEQ